MPSSSSRLLGALYKAPTRPSVKWAESVSPRRLTGAQSLPALLASSALGLGRFPIVPAVHTDPRLTFVRDSLQEFFVRFHGPTESVSLPRIRKHDGCSPLTLSCPSTSSALREGNLEDSRRTARPVPIQVALDWLHEQDFPPEYRRDVRLAPGPGCEQGQLLIRGADLSVTIRFGRHRSGSVCLDGAFSRAASPARVYLLSADSCTDFLSSVINQTWSPMFGAAPAV